MKINENPNSPKDTIKAADYIVSFIENMGIGHIFLVTGAGSMHLNDAIGRNKNIQYVCTHHEQAAAMAAEAYARVKDSLGVAMVTTGPGGTNAITGLAGAWIDSIPCLFISGQIALKDTIRNTGLRQRGVQEVDIISIVKSLTKYSVMITDVKDIKYHLQKAVYLAKSGRPGPVWLDIPLDVQGSFINVDELNEFKPSAADECHCDSSAKLQEKVYKALEILKASERPIIWIGNGVRLAGAKSDLKRVLEKLKIPVLTTWSGADLIPDEHELFIGRPGLFGQRAANFAVQNADTIITVGNRLSIPQTGFNFMAFARASKKVFVDIDINELSQKPFKPDIAINSDAKDFLIELDRQLEIFKPNDLRNLIKTCRQWKLRYPLVLPDYLKEKNYVNSYVFVDMLSEELNESDIKLIAKQKDSVNLDFLKKDSDTNKIKTDTIKLKTIDKSTPDAICFPISENNIPGKIINNLKKKFKKPEDIKWFTSKNNFVGIFKNSKISGNYLIKAEYDSDATLVKTIFEITSDELPEAVSTYVKNNFSNHRIIKTRLIINSGKEEYYQIKLLNKENQFTTIISEVLLDKKGKLYK